jgi:hypothetical protein
VRFELSSPLRQGQILHFVFDNWRLSGAHVLNASCVVRSSTVTTLHNNGVPDELIGRCGPLFNHVRCGGTGVTEYPAGAIYCNEANGWCGNTEEHRNAQPSTEYDFIAASETLVNNANKTIMLQTSTKVNLHSNGSLQVKVLGEDAVAGSASQFVFWLANVTARQWAGASSVLVRRR